MIRIPEGYRAEVLALTYGRGRLVITDGVSIDEFW